MADQTDVLNAIKDLVVQAVYPLGTSFPSVAGVDVIIVEGWPVRNKLDDLLKAGKAVVSIFGTGMEKPIKYYFRQFKTVEIQDATILADVSGNDVTISGVISIPQAVMIIVDGIGYAYEILLTDTIDTIAENLSSLIPGSTYSGNVITIPGAYEIIARITVSAKTSMSIARQEKVFMISCWCPSPDIRNLLAPPIDAYLKYNYSISLSDGYAAQMFHDHSEERDDLQVPLIFRRDLYFKVQYSTTIERNYPIVTCPVENLEIVGRIN